MESLSNMKTTGKIGGTVFVQAITQQENNVNANRLSGTGMGQASYPNLSGGATPPSTSPAATEECFTQYLLNRLSMLIERNGITLQEMDLKLDSLLGSVPRTANESSKDPEPLSVVGRIAACVDALQRQTNWLCDLSERLKKI